MLTCYLLLLIALILAPTVTFLARWGSRRGAPAMGITFWCNVTGVFYTSVLAGSQLGELPDAFLRQDGYWAIAAGIFGATSSYALFVALRRGPTGPIGIMQGMSLLLPILFSLFFLHEKLNVWQWSGMAAVLVAMLVIQLRSSKVCSIAEGRSWFWYALVAMIGAGFFGIILKIATMTPQPLPIPVFLCIVAGTVAILFSFGCCRNRIAIVTGMGISLASMTQTVLVMNLFAYLDLSLIYLVVIGGAPPLTIILAALLLRERYPLELWGAAALGSAGIVALLV